MQAPSIPIVVTTPVAAAREVVDEIVALVRERKLAGRAATLGLATGRTPREIYDELARRHREERLDLSNLVTFNLDEYLGLRRGHPRSFRRQMEANLFRRIGLAPDSHWIPACDLERSQVAAHCREYERAIADVGGLDLQILGVGRNGHVGFNEPGSPRESRTREVRLAESTRADAAAHFGGLDEVPHSAITMGVATILEARRIRVLAFGAGKREIVRRMLHEPVGPELPATYLREHRDVKLYLDSEAAGDLSR